jgi:hypothetical protein
MSRRIAVIFAAAVGTAIAVIPAHADRECFGGICRMPDVADPPAEPVAPPAATAVQPAQVDPRPPAAVAPRAAAPAAIRPQAMDVTAPKAKPAQAAQQTVPPRFTIEEELLSRPIRHSARNAEPPRQVLASRQAQSYVESEPDYAIPQGPVHNTTPPTSSLMIAGAPTHYGDDGILPAHPNMYPDPTWKLCQIDDDPQGARYYHCGPYSYHPYGANGYRPLGTYKPYRPAPIYVYAPDARIISLKGAD